MEYYFHGIPWSIETWNSMENSKSDHGISENMSMEMFHGIPWNSMESFHDVHGIPWKASMMSIERFMVTEFHFQSSNNDVYLFLST